MCKDAHPPMDNVYNVEILEDIPNMIKNLEQVNEKMSIKSKYPYRI